MNSINMSWLAKIQASRALGVEAMLPGREWVPLLVGGDDQNVVWPPGEVN